MSTLDTLVQGAIAEVRKVLAGSPAAGNADDVAKATGALSSALYGVSLEAPAKSLIPFLPTWMTDLPREMVKTGNTHTYKRITKLSITGKSTAAEGTAGNDASYTVDNPSVTFGVITSGVFNLTYEAQKAAGDWMDLLGGMTTHRLLLGRRNETAHMLGGTITALGAVDASIAVTVADNTSVTGTLANAAHYVYIKALNGPAMQKAILANACVLPATGTHKTFAGIAATVDQTDGWGIESTVATATPTLNKGLTITWAPIPGAAGYGIFAGTATGITNCKCQGVVGQCSVVLTALNTSGSAGVSGDNSADANGMTGLLGLIVAAGSGAYVKDCAAGLTAAVGNGIPEIDTMLASCYSQALGIDDGYLVMGLQTRAQVTRKLGAGSSTTLARLMIPVAADNTFIGGMQAVSYIHPITTRLVPIVTDPNLYDGVILWVPRSIPYVDAEVPAPLKVWGSYDWTAFEYPYAGPKRVFENRARLGLACYLPPAFGLLHNIWNA